MKTKREDVRNIAIIAHVDLSLIHILEKHSITEGSSIKVIQNCMGDLIIGTREGKVAVGREIACRIKV